MFLFICKTIKHKDNKMDSRVMSILLNLDLNLDTSQVANQYAASKKGIDESQQGYKKKVYRTLTATFKECYLTGSLKYGNNFIM